RLLHGRGHGRGIGHAIDTGQTLGHFLLEHLNRHTAGTFSPEVSAHTVGHSVEPQCIVAHVAVFVVIALETDVGRAPAAKLHRAYASASRGFTLATVAGTFADLGNGRAGLCRFGRRRTVLRGGGGRRIRVL